ncbi:hypothetical protein BCV69DRAFT_296365 [Microstroma glucosiphilum]|uniref:Uncharacterized protein n=1 Tax=Pseudomicrostroma glucosiphilum TaxID=1684307 RepID=A0A316ULI5_9BASI|nr:hypothetical protein BCV69DRAFT_296365 [Pseudomicrostroma glucosiphilum]PWN24065.1 hypothetical protein BCV69DRAFT_296365 [Pseudomicrostroma glucosiphilum]
MTDGNNASSTSNLSTLPVALSTASTSSSSSSRPQAPPLSQASPLSASIPSLRRRAEEAGAAKAATSSSVNERLARARQQAARRPVRLVEDEVEDNVALQACGVAGSSSSSARSRPRARGTSTNTPAASASARAGLAYLAASALRTQELEEARRNTALRRQLAGPVPPRSWKGEFLAGGAVARANGTGGSSMGGNKQGVRRTGTQVSLATSEEETEEQLIERAQQRHLQVQPWSVFHPLLPPCPTYGSAQRATSTLRDICLSLIFEVLATHTCSSGLLDQTTRLEIEEDAPWLPGHLKERIVALAARSGARCAMNDEAFERLYFSPLVWEEEEEEEEAADEHEHEETSEAKMQPEAVSDSDGGDLDDWERGSDEVAQPSTALTQGTPPHCWPSMDLSYAQLRPSTMRKLLLGPTSATSLPTLSSNVTLRYLSLAGQTSAGSPNLLAKSTFKLLASSLPNLEHLCLAGQHLSFTSSPSSSSPSSSKGRQDDLAPLPWASLWRGCRKLRLLDLSYTTGLGSGAAALVKSTVRENGVTLPRLDYLLLKGSDAEFAWFARGSVESRSGADDARGVPLPLFLTTSHARHWARVREKQRGRAASALAHNTSATGDAPARDAALDSIIIFSEEDIRSSGAACAKQLTSLALLMDTFRGRMGGGKERWCEIWI